MLYRINNIHAFSNSKKLYPAVVRVTKIFPLEARYLKDQICRSANAVHADIAEGYGRSVAEFKMYLTRALGSCNELLSHLDDAMSVGYLKKETGEALIKNYTIVGKQIYRLRENWK